MATIYTLSWSYRPNVNSKIIVGGEVDPNSLPPEKVGRGSVEYDGPKFADYSASLENLTPIPLPDGIVGYEQMLNASQAHGENAVIRNANNTWVATWPAAVPAPPAPTFTASINISPLTVAVGSQFNLSISSGKPNAAVTVREYFNSGLINTLNTTLNGSGNFSSSYTANSAGTYYVTAQFAPADNTATLLTSSTITASNVVVFYKLSGVNITNQGSDYSSAPSIQFVGGGGTGAAATANMVLDYTTPGSYYFRLIQKEVFLGYDATAPATFVSNVPLPPDVIGITNAPPNFTFEQRPMYQIDPTPVIIGTNFFGSIADGTYTSLSNDPFFSWQENAQVQATFSGGALTSVTVLSTGANITNTNSTSFFFGTPSNNCTLRLGLQQTNPIRYANFAIISSIANAGNFGNQHVGINFQINCTHPLQTNPVNWGTETVTQVPPQNYYKLGSVTVTNQGSGYTSPPAIQFIGGDGSGAAATAQMVPV